MDFEAWYAALNRLMREKLGTDYSTGVWDEYDPQALYAQGHKPEAIVDMMDREITAFEQEVDTSPKQ